MRCRRCDGLMVAELFDDVKEYAISSKPQGTRCINCGNIEDAVIYANRVGPPSRQRTARYEITTEVKAACCRH